RPSIVGADIADQRVNALGKAFERMDERVIVAAAGAPRRCFALEKIESFGNVVELPLEPATLRTLAHFPRATAFAGAFADRHFHPFAHGNSGAPRRLARRGPSIGLHGINAPGDARGHSGSDSGVRSRARRRRCAPPITFHSHGKWGVNAHA